MRIEPDEHRRHDWRIEAIAPDFTLIDAWSLPAEGGPEEFAHLVAMIEDLDPADDQGSRLTRGLFRVRLAVGRWLGWDEPRAPLAIPGCTETTLRDRLPPDERLGEHADQSAASASTSPFSPVYRDDREYFAEISNSTVHAVMHLGWVPSGPGRYRGQMGVYVKNRGRFGRWYMAAIAPFRHWIVYPALMRRIERMWSARPSGLRTADVTS